MQPQLIFVLAYKDEREPACVTQISPHYVRCILVTYLATQIEKNGVSPWSIWLLTRENSSLLTGCLLRRGGCQLGFDATRSL